MQDYDLVGEKIEGFNMGKKRFDISKATLQRVHSRRQARIYTGFM